MLLAYEDLVDTVRPGDRVEVTGTLRYTDVPYTTVQYSTVLSDMIFYDTI